MFVWSKHFRIALLFNLLGHLIHFISTDGNLKDFGVLEIYLSFYLQERKNVHGFCLQIDAVMLTI